MIRLKDGTEVEDPRLDRLASFDVRSTAYPIRALLSTAAKPRSYTWSCSAYLDQGNEGACVGHGVAHDVAARPVVLTATSALAFSIYKEAQKIDEWPGEAYSGTSVLAGVKVATTLGYFGEYRWAFGLNDLVLAVGFKGPAILGVNWWSGMVRTDSEGYIRATGQVEGGHCLLCKGVDVKKKRFRLHNSWGKDWGMGGDCYISFDDMEKLLNESGEACIPVKRNRV